MKNRLARYESYFRGLFGLIFPVVLTLGLVYAGLQFSDARQRADAAKKSGLWQEKAEIILAAVRSGHTFSDLVTEAGNRLAKDLEKLTGSAITIASFSQFFAKYFNKSLLGDQSLAWFFEIVDGKIECKTAPGLSSTRLRVMQRVFAGLYEFANNKDLNLIEISNAEKFIKGVLGLNSAPLSIAQHREGRLTPVTFEGKKFFFFWRQFLADGKPVAGTIVMFPAAMSEKTEPVLQMVANRVLEETRRHLAVAFLPSRHFKDRLKRIFPAGIYADESYLKELNSQLDKLLSENDDKGNRVYESHDHLFLRGFVTEDLPYDAVVFAPRPNAVKYQDTPFLPFAVAISFFWVSVYLIVFWQTGRAGLPLALAFRLLFFFAGLLPIFLLVSAGVSLIDESYNIDFNELRQANSEHLNSINEKSDGLLNIFGYHLSEMLKEKDLQNLLNDGNSQSAQKAFDIIRERLQKLELSLDYMYVFVPGGSSEMLVADQRIRQNVKVNMNLTAPGVYSINKEFARSSPLPEIRLDASQANNYKIMSGLPNNFLMDSFFLSYERENFLTRGTTGKDYQYTVILSKRGMIASYLVFAADSENIYRNFLARELDILNFSQSHLFMAAEHLSNSDFSFFPFKKIHALQGNLGRRAYHFLKKCRGSIFEKYITDQDHLFLFQPMSKMPRYSGGCIISLASANRSRQEKRLFLYLTAVLLACLMYVIASFATTHMLVPLERINFVLQRISEGNLNQRIDFVRKDELGQLGSTVNLMISGFKERLRLGKFVSTTLDQSLAKGLSLNDLKKARIITGTVLFSDIRSFTTMSESQPPDEIATMLNTHLEVMSEEIQKSGGQIEQFIGDAIVAFFPDIDEADSRISAMRAALAVYHAHRQINIVRITEGKFAYSIGTGLQHGQVIAGSLVTPQRCEFSIIGEARHQAEEHEAMSKLGSQTRIVIPAGFVQLLDSYGFARYQPLPSSNVYELVEKEGKA